MSMKNYCKKPISPFVETICRIGGVAQRLPQHQARYEATLHHFYGNEVEPTSLSDIVKKIPISSNKEKVRVVYDETGILSVSSEPYVVRSMRSLQLVCADEIDYSYKSTDRSTLNALMQQRGHCDNIIIVKHGWLTDTSYTNLAFWDGLHWYTPAHPLLKGTMRAALLAEERLIERDIGVDEIGSFKTISPFNAMLNLGDIRLGVECVEQPLL